MPLEYGTASYGHIWAPEAEGKATVRGHSGLVGLGLWMEGEGKLPMPMVDAFKSEDNMVKVYDAILAEAIARKKNIAQFWSNENEAQGAFRVNGCVVGQTWDSSAAALGKEGLPIGYVAPKEGALAWMEGVSIPSGAENVDQAYAFINFMLTPEAGAAYTNATSINSTAVGAAEMTSMTPRTSAAYPGDARGSCGGGRSRKLVCKRNEYQDRFRRLIFNGRAHVRPGVSSSFGRTQQCRNDLGATCRRRRSSRSRPAKFFSILPVRLRQDDDPA